MQEVIFVILEHLTQAIPSGFIGSLIFISGYIPYLQTVQNKEVYLLDKLQLWSHPVSHPIQSQRGDKGVLFSILNLTTTECLSNMAWKLPSSSALVSSLSPVKPYNLQSTYVLTMRGERPVTIPCLSWGGVLQQKCLASSLLKQNLRLPAAGCRMALVYTQSGKRWK